MRTIGFVGLGAMGLPMAQRLARRDYAVRGFDLKRPAMDALAEAGGEAAASAKEAVRGADALILMVVSAAQARSVLAEGGALTALAPDAVVILMATCAPADAAALARDVIATGRRFVDAPVSGGVKGATGGTLTIMAAAAKPVFEATKPLLQVLGDKLFHVGEEPGQGAMVKTVNQLLAGVHIAAAAEAFSLAARGRARPRRAARDPLRLGGLELDAEGPRPAHSR
jgi:putative dehydrogenase